MSDEMMFSIAKMPYELAMEYELSRRQFYANTQRLAAALEAAQAERDAMREVLKDADNELDWLDEDMDTCDHSVGVCTCSYWNMRRKMKAALAKGKDNEQ